MTISTFGAAYYEKSGTIDTVVWSAQSYPTRVIALLSFTDGEELAGIAVDERLAQSMVAGRNGTFAFHDVGGMGALTRLRTRSADVRADRSVWQAAGNTRLAWGALNFAVALALITIAMTTPFVAPAAAALLFVGCGIRSAHVANCRLQTAARIGSWHAEPFPPELGVLEPTASY